MQTTIKTTTRSKILPGKIINKDFTISDSIAHIIDKTIKGIMPDILPHALSNNYF